MKHLRRLNRNAILARYRLSVWLILAFSLSFVAALVVQGSRIADPYAIDEDFSNAFFMHRLQDKNLLANEYTQALRPRTIDINLGSYLLVLDAGSPGYSLLFLLFSFIGPIQLLSKLLIFPLLLVSIYFIFQIGRKFRGDKLGFALAWSYTVLILASPSAISVASGLQRSFTTTLLLSSLYYLIEKQYGKASLIVAISGLIYPPAFLLCVTTYFLSLIKRSELDSRLNIEKKPFVLLVGATLAVMVLLIPVLSQQLLSARDGIAEASQQDYSLISDPTFMDGGRRQLFEIFPILGRAGIATNGQTLFYILILAILSLGIFWLNPKSLAELPKAIKALFFAGLFCYALSWAVIFITNSFVLYLPSRYTQAGLFIFLLLYVVIEGKQSLILAARGVAQSGSRLVFWLTSPLIALSLLLAFFPPQYLLHAGIAELNQLRWFWFTMSLLLTGLVFLTARRSRQRMLGKGDVRSFIIPRWLRQFLWLIGILFILLYVRVFRAPFYVASPEEREIFSFLEQVPKDALIAGSPCDLDGVPIFARRNILFSCERPHPDEQVILDGLEAYYGATMEEVINFCGTYGVDYLVVNQSSFESQAIEKGEIYFEPFNSQVSPMLRQQSTFALQSLTPELIEFAAGELAVVRCDKSLIVATE